MCLHFGFGGEMNLEALRERRRLEPLDGDILGMRVLVQGYKLLVYCIF